MRIAPPKCSTCVVPKSAVHGNTSGSSARGTSKTASSSSLQHSRWMSKSIVRDAFVVAEKYGSSRSPVCTATSSPAPRARSASQFAAVQTGLLLDPYFSATKIAWLLDNVDGLRARAEAGEIAFGTVDTWLIWNLTGGARHVTDMTNASRTMLFDIHRLCWSDELLAVFDVPRALLPDVLPCTADFGTTQVEHFGGAIRIAGVAGDQQAALVGQAGFMPGLAKSTYGTGSFVVLNTGERIVRSEHGLLATIAFAFERI